MVRRGCGEGKGIRKQPDGQKLLLQDSELRLDGLDEAFVEQQSVFVSVKKIRRWFGAFCLGEAFAVLCSFDRLGLLGRGFLLWCWLSWWRKGDDVI